LTTFGIKIQFLLMQKNKLSHGANLIQIFFLFFWVWATKLSFLKKFKSSWHPNLFTTTSRTIFFILLVQNCKSAKNTFLSQKLMMRKHWAYLKNNKKKFQSWQQTDDLLELFSKAHVLFSYKYKLIFHFCVFSAVGCLLLSNLH
jgi:hypothetical protein